MGLLNENNRTEYCVVVAEWTAYPFGIWNIQVEISDGRPAALPEIAFRLT